MNNLRFAISVALALTSFLSTTALASAAPDISFQELTFSFNKNFDTCPKTIEQLKKSLDSIENEVQAKVKSAKLESLNGKLHTSQVDGQLITFFGGRSFSKQVEYADTTFDCFDKFEKFKKALGVSKHPQLELTDWLECTRGMYHEIRHVPQQISKCYQSTTKK